MIELGENRYGKSRVRLLRVRRDADRHYLREWTLDILLEGDFATCYRDGDNSKILPTDTLKNTVYSMARRSAAPTMEDFGKELIDFLLQRNPQVSHAEVALAEKIWERLVTQGKPHPTSFVQSTGEHQTARVDRSQNGSFSVCSGLKNLTIMKTARSGFEGFIEDPLTTLPPTADRLLGTCLAASWLYSSPDAEFDRLRTSVREVLLAAFAQHNSKSVQHTLYAMGECVLNSVAEVGEIELKMPNLHCLPVDLSRFGQDNPNEIFLPIDEPQGYIEACIRRRK
ncbi:MAG: urate oxidase [Acidobacteria bacterium]|nr:urate oxidase [Acidobacteriota bacterium]